MSRVNEEQEEFGRRVARQPGSAPRLNSTEVRTFRAKVFKSGNSLALRLPAELGLAPGIEMELRVEDDHLFSFTPVERPRRKLNVDAFWGKATGLKLIAPEDRIFEERKLLWERSNEDE